MTVSSEEVARGKPSPDVYLEVVRRLDVPPGRVVAIEDSGNGILSAKRAGTVVVAILNKRFPPGEAALAQVAVVLDSLAELAADVVDASAAQATRRPTARP